MTEGEMEAQARGSCCKDDTYSAAVSGAWPKLCTAGCSFMVTPYQSKKVTNNPYDGYVVHPDFVVPMGVMTAVFTDSKGGGVAITVQTASFEMEVSNPKEFLASPHFESTMRTSIADSMEGVDMSMIVNIRAILVNATSASNRRLAGEKLKVTFDVLIPATSALKITATSIDATKLSANIVKTAKANGITVAVTVDAASLVMSAPVKAGGGGSGSNTTAEPIIIDKEQTDGATRMGGLSAILVVLMTLAGMSASESFSSK